MKSRRIALSQDRSTMKAPELYGDYWFNAPPLSISAVQGQPVLLWFWNYSSPASLRLLPVMKQWNAMYGSMGLLCIGVHTPDFPFAAEKRNVEAHLKKENVEFPVVTDNERHIAGAYRISEFPAFVLIGGNGNIYDIVTHITSVSRLERSIQYLLRQTGYYGELPILESFFSDPMEEVTSIEMTTGYVHGSLGNTEGYSPELPAEYIDPGIHVEGRFYLHGLWQAQRNAIRYDGDPNEGYLVCSSLGEDIDIIIGSDQKGTLRVKAEDAPLHVENMGSDVRLDAKGNSVATIEAPSLISLFRGTDNRRHSVKLFPGISGMTFYLVSLTRALRAQDADQPFHSN